MKFGVREICDVVLKAKANQIVGNKKFYKGEPVIYFDTLKTSSMEGAATTVYAQGGRGNSRLVAWEGERTITFTMEDALISPAGFMILSGAGLVEGAKDNLIPVHFAETTEKVFLNAESPTTAYVITKEVLSSNPAASIYVMGMRDGEIISEPFIGKKCKTEPSTVYTTLATQDERDAVLQTLKDAYSAGNLVEITTLTDDSATEADDSYAPTKLATYFGDETIVMVDYYSDRGEGAQQIEITPDKFGGNYYLEASTLFRDTNGVDMPAEFIIPNCKIQSNFTFTMASSGDPSTFTFTMDAFPDYTRFNPTKKVLAAIQIIADTTAENSVLRNSTPSNHADSYFN